MSIYSLNVMRKATQAIIRRQEKLISSDEMQQLEIFLENSLVNDPKILLEKLKMGLSIAIKTGTLTHAVIAAVIGDHFIICNRGLGSRKPIEVFQFDRNSLNLETLKMMLSLKTLEDYQTLFFEKLPKILKFAEKGEFEKNLETACKLPLQTIENCHWTSSEAVVWAFMAIKEGQFTETVKAKSAQFDAWLVLVQSYLLESYLGTRHLRSIDNPEKIQKSQAPRTVFHIDNNLVENAKKHIESGIENLDAKYAEVAKIFAAIVLSKS